MRFLIAPVSLRRSGAPVRAVHNSVCLTGFPGVLVAWQLASTGRTGTALLTPSGSEGTAEDENTGPRVRAGWGEAPLISPLSSHLATLANTGEHWRTLARRRTCGDGHGDGGGDGADGADGGTARDSADNTQHSDLVRRHM